MAGIPKAGHYPIVMDILLIIVCFIIGGLLNLIIKSRAKIAYNLSLVYITLSVRLVFSAWLLYFTKAKTNILINTFESRLHVEGLLWYCLLGYLMTHILCASGKAATPDDRNELKKIIRSTLWASSILTANSFIIKAAVGKIQPYTACYFSASGYAIWFFYFILTTEFLGGLGILFHFKLKTGVPAATVLMLIMIGALYTHRNNGEPLIRAHAAVTQFITLSLMIVIYYFEKQANYLPLISNRDTAINNLNL
jgi:hypothetical protein